MTVSPTADGRRVGAVAAGRKTHCLSPCFHRLSPPFTAVLLQAVELAERHVFESASLLLQVR